MVDIDTRIRRSICDLLTVPEDEHGDWRSIVAAAEMRHRSPFRLRRLPLRRALGVVLALVAAGLVGLPALGVTQGWWFVDQREPDILPLGASPVTVASRTTSGIPWALTGYVSRGSGACVALTPHPEKPGNSEGASLGCGFIEGLAHPPAASGLHSLIYVASVPGKPFPPDVKFFYGAANSSVARVELHLSDGATIDTSTLTPPGSLENQVRFFVVSLPADRIINKLTTRDQSGNAIENWELPVGQ